MQLIRVCHLKHMLLQASRCKHACRNRVLSDLTGLEPPAHAGSCQLLRLLKLLPSWPACSRDVAKVGMLARS